MQAVLCANISNPYCGQTLTAGIPTGSGLEVICSRDNDYYIEVLAHPNQEGYVPESDVSNPPSGLTDCNTEAHPAIYAAANAIGYLGAGQQYAGLCLQFVADAWSGAGLPIPGDDDAIDWWNAYSERYAHAVAGNPRFLTPRRGALVFWGPNQYSAAGHVAIAE